MKRKELDERRLVLQLFAEEGEGANEPENDNGQEEGAAGNESKDGEGKKPEAKYTDADMDRIISEKFAKWQAKKDKEIDEAKKLAEMNAQQKAEYERDELQKQLDELKAKEAKAQLTNEARKMLGENEVSVGDELLSILVANDADTTKKTVDNFISLYTKAVEKGVKNALKGKNPKSGGGKETMTKEQIIAIKDPAERQRLIAEHIDLFK